MAPTPIQQNLVSSNKTYAASFDQGHLALPPAKKYAVGTSDNSILWKLHLNFSRATIESSWIQTWSMPLIPLETDSSQ